MKLTFQAIGILTNVLPPNQMGVIYLMGMGMAIPDDVTKQDLVMVISVLCKKLGWIEMENDQDMEMKLNLEAIEILTSILEPNQMGAIYMMAMDKAMPEDVTNEDLTKIINVLCRELNWVEEYEDNFEKKGH